MNWKVALGVAAMLQEHLDRTQEKDKLEALAQFVIENANENLGLDENLHNLAELHQKQALKARRDFAMDMK